MDPYLVNRVYLTVQEFNQLREKVHQLIGIDLQDDKRIMLESRFQRRLRELQLSSFSIYLQKVQRGELPGEENIIIRLATTNTTRFFREAPHFSIFSSLLEEYIGMNQAQSIKIWSAGCSSGEEVWSLAIRASEAIGHSNFSFQVLGTDVDEHVLQLAKDAIYDYESVTQIPMDTLKKYFLKSKFTNKQYVAIKPSLRERVHFKNLNLANPAYGLQKSSFFTIFCRNVLIYFSKVNQRLLVERLLEHLQTGGYLFTGHSESLTGFQLPIKQIAPSVYQKL